MAACCKAWALTGEEHDKGCQNRPLPPYLGTTGPAYRDGVGEDPKLGPLSKNAEQTARDFIRTAGAQMQNESEGGQPPPAEGAPPASTEDRLNPPEISSSKTDSGKIGGGSDRAGQGGKRRRVEVLTPSRPHEIIGMATRVASTSDGNVRLFDGEVMTAEFFDVVGWWYPSLHQQEAATDGVARSEERLLVTVFPLAETMGREYARRGNGHNPFPSGSAKATAWRIGYDFVAIVEQKNRDDAARAAVLPHAARYVELMREFVEAYVMERLTPQRLAQLCRDMRAALEMGTKAARMEQQP